MAAGRHPEDRGVSALVGELSGPLGGRRQAAGGRRRAGGDAEAPP
ncbi:hypothetical protein ACFRI7_33485, partial [Streptomyces sp. NPDC056716]